MPIRPHPFVAALAAAFLVAAPVHAEIYRWVDEQGHEHFTTSLDEIPEALRADAANAAAERPEINRAVRDEMPAKRDVRAMETERQAAEPALEESPAGSEPPAEPEPGKRRAWSIEAEFPGGHDEAWWRAEHEEVAGTHAALQEEIARLEEDGADRHPGHRRGRASRRRYEQYLIRHERLEEARRELTRAERALERFEERARRAGVPPGWLR